MCMCVCVCVCGIIRLAKIHYKCLRILKIGAGRNLAWEMILTALKS